MSTNTIEMIEAIQTVTTDPGIMDAFNKGLLFGAGMVAVLFVFSFLRSTVGGGHEEL